MIENEEVFQDSFVDDELEESMNGFTQMIENADQLAGKMMEILMHEMTERGVSLETCIMSLSRSLMYMSQLYFKNEEEFKEKLEHVQSQTLERVEEAILNPQPCGECEDCLSQHNFCEHIRVDDKMTLDSIPMLMCTLLEHAFWIAHLQNPNNLGEV